MTEFARDGQGSAVRWFALTAAVLSVASMAGVRALDWLSQSGHVTLFAYPAPAAQPNARLAGDAGVDPMPTGSVPPTGLVIRIR